jgi:hypothetical protein
MEGGLDCGGIVVADGDHKKSMQPAATACKKIHGSTTRLGVVVACGLVKGA